MKKSIQTLVAKAGYSPSGGLEGGFGSIRGGTGASDFMTNFGNCTNSSGGNCAGSTNTGNCMNTGNCANDPGSGQPTTNDMACTNTMTCQNSINKAKCTNGTPVACNGSMNNGGMQGCVITNPMNCAF